MADRVLKDCDVNLVEFLFRCSGRRLFLKDH
jgi:hypothetical protein